MVLARNSNQDFLKEENKATTIFLRQSYDDVYFLPKNLKHVTTKNAAISSNFLVLKFYGKAQFQHQEIR